MPSRQRLSGACIPGVSQIAPTGKDYSASPQLSALVTGASSGIVRAVALAIAAAGGSICLAGRDVERLEAAAGAARSDARAALSFRGDLDSDDAVEELASYIRRALPSFNTLIHCAGAHATGSVEDTALGQLDQLYRTNVRMPFALTQALLPQLKAQRGQIVFVNSSLGLHARRDCGAYAATKHALKAIADSLRQELGGDGIRVLTIYPGRTATPMIDTLCEAEQRAYTPELLLQPEDIGQIVVDVLRLPRTAEVTNLEIRPAFSFE